MKFILIFTVCSAISGTCNNNITLPKEFNSWSKCVGAGGELIQNFSVEMKEAIDDNKLYLSYFCNEISKEDA